MYILMEIEEKKIIKEKKKIRKIPEEAVSWKSDRKCKLICAERTLCGCASTRLRESLQFQLLHLFLIVEKSLTK